jgi:hypothetical protein
MSIFLEKSHTENLLEDFLSADHAQRGGGTDDDEIAVAFDHVITTATHFQLQRSPTDLSFYIADLAAHNAAGLRGLGAKHLIQPILAKRLGVPGQHLHGVTLTRFR